VVLLLLHEWRWSAAGFLGDVNARTPHLDAIAARGTTASHARVASLDPGENRHALLSRVGEVATAAGYDTMAAGCFDHRLPASGYERVSRCEPTPADDTPAHVWTGFGAGRSPLPEGEHPVGRTGGEAVRLLRTAREPFLLAVPFPAPATPLDPPAPWDRLLRPDLLAMPKGFALPARAANEAYPVDFETMTEARFRKYLACYHGMLGFIDHQVGRILGTLAARGFGRTVLVATASSGHYLGDEGRTARERDPAPMEALLRVPLLAAGLPGFEPGDRPFHAEALAGLLCALMAPVDEAEA
jgi:arylsulfatase A-like enzyme